MRIFESMLLKIFIGTTGLFSLVVTSEAHMVGRTDFFSAIIVLSQDKQLQSGQAQVRQSIHPQVAKLLSQEDFVVHFKATPELHLQTLNSLKSILSTPVGKLACAAIRSYHQTEIDFLDYYGDLDCPKILDYVYFSRQSPKTQNKFEGMPEIYFVLTDGSKKLKAWTGYGTTLIFLNQNQNKDTDIEKSLAHEIYQSVDYLNSRIIDFADISHIFSQTYGVDLQEDLRCKITAILHDPKIKFTANNLRAQKFEDAVFNNLSLEAFSQQAQITNCVETIFQERFMHDGIILSQEKETKLQRSQAMKQCSRPHNQKSQQVDFRFQKSFETLPSLEQNKVSVDQLDFRFQMTLEKFASLETNHKAMVCDMLLKPRFYNGIFLGNWGQKGPRNGTGGAD